MYMCVCNAINEEELRQAIKKYDSIEKWFDLQNITYKCALCRNVLENTFMNNKEKENDKRK